MSTPPSKQKQDQVLDDLAHLSSDDLLIIDKHPLAERLVGLAFYAAFMVFVVWIVPSHAWSPTSPARTPMIIVGCFQPVLLIMMLCSVESLSIDFAQRHYEACSGIWPFVETEEGPLSEVSHVRLVSYMQTVHRRYASTLRRCVDVRIVWTGRSPCEFTLKTSSCGDNEVSIGLARAELRAYAAQLATRLEVPIIEDTEVIEDVEA